MVGRQMPTRYLKPGIRDSETIDKLSPMAEVLYYRLLVTVDDFGRYDARFSMIKSQCFPVKESVSAKDCQKLLTELSNCGLLVLYTANGGSYLQMLKWDNKPRATASLFPACEDACMQTYTDASQPHTNLPVTVTVTKTKTVTKTETETATPDGVSPQTWKDWLKLRKTKKAPVTQTVINGAIEQAGKAGLSLEDFLQIWCRRGSQGLEADWLKPSERGKPQQSFNQLDREAGMRRWEEQTGRIHPDRQTSGIVIDIGENQLEIGP